MNINVDKFYQVLNELNKDIFDYGGISCPSASVFIGEINGNPVRLTVMTEKEATEEHDYECTNDDHLILEETD